jgi:hypothetical protein
VVGGAAVSEYLDFHVELRRDSRKTDRALVLAKSNGEVLGTIHWFGRWRQYVFHPTAGTVFNPRCLDAISVETQRMTSAYRTEERAVLATPPPESEGGKT